MCARYSEEALHHQRELGAGQAAQRLLEEEHHGHKQPREQPCAEDGDNHKGIDQDHRGLRCASKVLTPSVECRPLFLQHVGAAYKTLVAAALRCSPTSGTVAYPSSPDGRLPFRICVRELLRTPLGRSSQNYPS